MSYEVLESRKTYEGKIVTITVDKLRMPDGSEAYRETVIRKKNAAGVLAVDTDGRLLFVRQYRHPFREETGKRAGRAEFLCELYPSVGFCTEKIQLFFATELTAGTQKLDADEFVEIEKYTLEEAIAMIHKGEIKDGKTIAALFAWQARKNA